MQTYGIYITEGAQGGSTSIPRKVPREPVELALGVGSSSMTRSLKFLHLLPSKVAAGYSYKR